MKNKLSPQTIHEIKAAASYLEAIPDERWSVDALEGGEGRRCAVGHLMAMGIGGAGIIRIQELIYDAFASSMVDINDYHCVHYQQATPKARVLAALHDLISL
jgi:hypothetical protein